MMNYSTKLKRYQKDIEEIITLSDINTLEIHNTIDKNQPQSIHSILMLDMDYCKQRIDATLKHVVAQDESLNVSRVVTESLFLREQEKMVDLQGKMNAIIADLNKAYFDLNYFIPYSMAENFQSLQKGKLWYWLYRRALPTSEKIHNVRRDNEFAVFATKNPAAFSGGYGFGSEDFWPEGVQVMQSNLSFEIMCLRFVKGGK